MSEGNAKLKSQTNKGQKMEKNSMALMEEALAILKEKYEGRNDLAYASFAGYAIATANLKTAELILSIVKEKNWWWLARTMWQPQTF